MKAKLRNGKLSIEIPEGYKQVFNGKIKDGDKDLMVGEVLKPYWRDIQEYMIGDFIRECDAVIIRKIK